MRIVSGLLATCLSVCMFCTPLHAEQSFSDFEAELFQKLMESDYTNMHFTVRDYESYGIQKPDVNIGEVKWEDYEKSVKEDQENLDTLHEFDYDALSESEKTDYKTLEFYLENDKMRNSYPYFDWAFNSAEGVIDNLLTTFTEFVFYDPQDIEDYLSTLQSVPSYLDDCLVITEKQAEAGYFLTDAMLEETQDSIAKFVEKTDDNELIEIFNKNIDNLDGLSEEEKEDYKQRNADLVLHSCIPAYQKVSEKLAGMKGSRKGEYNVSSLKDGAAYYEVLAQYKTSIDADVETIQSICTQYLEKTIAEYSDLLTQHSGELDETIDMKDAEEILSYLENHLDSLPELKKINYKVEYLDASVANNSIVAYYLNPPIDDMRDNVIKINGDNVSDNMDLYTTLAHEGFPGHLYQVNYYLSTNPAPIRNAISMMGYQEGWGMYAEGLALQTSGLNAYAAEYNKLEIELNYVLDAAVDLGVNGLGWGTKEISSYLNQLGLNDSLAKSLYDFVTEEPGTILPYGVGVSVFELLKEKAETELGDDFDLKEFNTVLLNGGDRPFQVVEEDVNAYCGIEGNENNIIPVKKNAEEKNADKTEKNDWNWILYGIGGITIIAIGGFAFVQGLRNRKEHPFS